MRLLLSALLFFVTIPGTLNAQTTSFDDVINYYHGAKNFNGAILIATDGKINYIHGTGLFPGQTGTDVNSKSKFKICSITKTFTAVIVLQLVEKGKLDLKATLGKYLPDYEGEAANKTTIENLLTYSSGLANCESYMGDTIYTIPITQDSFVAKFCSGKLVSEPSSKFNYNNGDYVLLGEIIESVTHKSFTENLNQWILKPLGMNNTGMLTNKDRISGLVQAFEYDDSLKTFSKDRPYLVENYFAAGAMYSTVEDLLKFDQGIFNGMLLSKASVDQMIAPHRELGDVGFGFWFSTGYGLLNKPFVYRPGGIYGSAANWIHVTGSNRAIIVLSNTNATNLFEMSQQLNGVATGQAVVLPAR